MAAVVHGTVADGYEPVRDAFVRNFEELGEAGAAVAVHRDGRKVVDLWGGTTDPRDATAPPWERDTAVVVRSATKGLAAAVPHLLHQRGQLDLDAPVGTYWPEFKANGKERVLVRHLLAHRAGLPALDTPLTPEQLLDGAHTARALAAQAPEWAPGTAHGYHPHTYGWLLSALMRRATGGRGLGRWFADEIARPLGLDAWIGLPDAVAAAAAAPGSARIARVAEGAAPPPARGAVRTRPKRAVLDAWADPGSLTRRAFDVVLPHPDENDPAYRAAELPASSGVATARALSRFYAALIGPVGEELTGPPESEGRRLFTPATLTQARSQESEGPDRVLLVSTRFGLGYMLHGPAAPMYGPGSFGHPGRGGSLGMADPESGLALGYVTNTLHKSVTSDPRPQAILRALRAVVG
ncbi:serine hydrolase domain-containing protein [Streptomyces cacaoi]|uniref:serine hydrolase domain-containing protein n=1 Tax=Streptomyces cacaoi TaxID=1898 RepID=UPI003330E635